MANAQASYVGRATQALAEGKKDECGMCLRDFFGKAHKTATLSKATSSQAAAAHDQELEGKLNFALPCELVSSSAEPGFEAEHLVTA